MLAAAIPNAVVDVYLEDQLDRKFLALRRVTSGLETRLGVMRERLETSERAVIDYRNRNLAKGFGTQKQLDQQLEGISRRLGTVSAEQAEQASELASIDALIAEQGPIAAAGLFDTPDIDRMLNQMTELTQRRERLLERDGADSPQAREIGNEIQRISEVIAAEVQRLRDVQANRVTLAAARVDALRDQLFGLETRAIVQAERDLQLAQFERDYEAEQTVYRSFLNQFTQTNEVADLQEGDAQITSYADPPPSPVAPNKKLAAVLGGIAGGFGGMGLVFLRTMTDSSVRSPVQLRRLTGGVTTFTQPRVGQFPLRRGDPLASVANNPFSALSESVRSLRSHLLLSAPKDKNAGIVVSVISTQSGSGKTTTSLLLARSFAQMGVPCVLIDADMRHPSIADWLGQPARPDLVEVLADVVPLDDALRTDPESRAQVLTARRGLKDPAGFLLSDAMGSLMQKLRQRFRVIIVDTAPLSPLSDATPMIRMSDNVVLMARYGSEIADVEAGVDILGRLGATKVCTVLSLAPRTMVTPNGHDVTS